MYIVGKEEIDAIAKVIRIGHAVPLRRRQRVRPLRSALRRLSRGQAFRARGERQQRARRRDDRGRARPRRRGADPGAHLHGDGDLGARRRRNPGDRRHRREHHHRPARRSRPRSGRAPRRSCPSICGGLPATWTRSWRSPSGTSCCVIEDACQGVGGGYEGRKFGSIGHIGASASTTTRT